MKFTIMARELADAVGWVSHALPKRPMVPVLAGILLEAGDDGVTLAAFDYDTSRRIAVELDAPIEPGKALLPGRVLVELVKALPKGELVDVAADDTEVTIRCGKAEFALPLIPVDDFPNLPKPPVTVGSIHSKMLVHAVAQVAIAAGKDDSLPMLTGVRIEAGDGLIHLATTDRYRLTWRTVAWTPALDGPEEVKALIPARVLADIVRGFPDGDVQVALDDGLACFSGDGRTTTVRLLDDQFIKFRDIFAKAVEETRFTAEVDSGDLAKAVKRVALLAERSSPARLSFGQGKVLVEAGGGDTGRASEPVDCKLDGDDVQVAFDPGKLLDALNAFGGGPVRIRMVGPGKAALFARPDDSTYRHLVMSIRLS